MDIALEEAKKAIGDLQGGKSPEEDGLPAEFYKALSDILTPRLLRVFKGVVLKVRSEDPQGFLRGFQGDIST